MKNKQINRYGAALQTACLVASFFLCAALANGSAVQKPATPPPSQSMDRKTVATFLDQAKRYVKLRNRVEGKLPKLSKDSTPEQITTHKKAFEEGVRVARANAKPGAIFTTGASEYLRRVIRTEFKGQDRKEVKETILDAETSGIPLKVNYPYPESKEVTAIPPTLLLTLPQLPKELNYRFVGRHMVLIDKENGLILDYLLNALP
jgi:hypothetical protein